MYANLSTQIFVSFLLIFHALHRIVSTCHPHTARSKWRENVYYRASHKRRHFQVRDTKKKNNEKILSMGENASQQCDNGVS